MKETTKKNNIKQLVIFFILLLTALLVSFWGIWNVYQAGDDVLAYQMGKHIRSEFNGSFNILHELCTVGHAVHWLPVSNIIIYLTHHNDQNTRISIVSLLSVYAISILIFFFARELGAKFFPALFGSLWIASAQTLVFPIASAWGPMNILGSVFVICAVWILWRWLNREMDNVESITFLCKDFILFLCLLSLAILTCESTIRVVILTAVLSAILIIYRYNRTLLKRLIILAAILSVWILVYFAIRYTLTDAPVPVIRAGGIEGYQKLRFDGLLCVKNIAMLLVGALNPINSYSVYGSYIEGGLKGVILPLFPAIFFGMTLIFGCFYWFKSLKGKDQLRAIFPVLLVLCSFFPQCFLGKVSEMYSMAILWPMALLSSLVLTTFFADRKYKIILMPILCLFIFVNISSARVKVEEILKTGDNAREVRLSMVRFTEHLPEGSRVAVICKPRIKQAFGRFGDRGVWASGQLWYNNNIIVERFDSCTKLSSIKKFDLILIERDDRRGFEILNDEYQANSNPF